MHLICAGKSPVIGFAAALQADFENANLSDVLMDRAVLNEANLKNANLERAVFTRCALFVATPNPRELAHIKSHRLTRPALLCETGFATTAQE